MDLSLFITFLAVSFVIIIIPGPNILAIVSVTIAHGKRKGLQTVLGTSSAMAVQLLFSAIGTSVMVQFLSDGFYVLKWLGVTYLLYLAIQHWRLSTQKETVQDSSPGGGYWLGFYVSLSNPKTILFFSALLPQFVNPALNYSYNSQIALLSISFLVMATIIDGSYALAAHILKKHLMNFPQGLRHRISAVLFGGAGLLLAGLKKA